MHEILLWEDRIPGRIACGPDHWPSIFPYRIDSKIKKPAVLVCPGGGYSHKAEHEGRPIAKWLNDIGVEAFVLNYRVAPYMHPYPFLDASRAIRYIRYNAKTWNIDPNKIGILGFSAGGHLAATVSTHFDYGKEDDDPIDSVSSRPDFMILAYPVITFGKYTHEGSKINLIGKDTTDDMVKHLSNECHVSKNTPPTFLWHTADDMVVPVENSMMFSMALSASKVPFEMHIYDSGAHGLGLALEDHHINTWTQLCFQWLKRQNIITYSS